ncbi:ABC transporter substrate-binding protein [Halococcus hamelinensis]|nr:ABC transporter substrate-binding protein [Halococcus hamelinensis]
MGHESARRTEPARRDYLRYSGAILGGGVLAGCTGGGTDGNASNASSGGANGSDATANNSGTSGSNASDDSGAQAGDGRNSYSVEMAPMGTVEFQSPPESVFTVLLHHADMALALGYGDSLTGMYNPEGFEESYNTLLERLDGVSVDWSDLVDTYNPDKELLYELDSDIHLEDPANMVLMDAWETEDVEEIRTNVSPWFGNSLSRNHSEPPKGWADRYRYYTLWEIFGKVAEVFQEGTRYEALSEIHTNLLSTIESGLPQSDDRPRTARVLLRKGIWVYQMNGPGTVRAHTRVFDVEDALADVPNASQIDIEGLAEADPEVVLVDGGLGPEWTSTKQQLTDEPAAQSITAVENDQVYPIGVRYGGPVMNVFQLETIAKQLFPEQFGEWPAYDGGPYPEFPEDEQLFDRQRMVDVINGDL